MNQVYEPGIWKSYSAADRADFLVEVGVKRAATEDYSYRDFASLPLKVREAIEGLENFEDDLERARR
jgi:hypothetical protein